ncbi:MAG: CCA tRNA nucleotidyltransferase [Thermoflexales bacterium]
MHSLLSKLTPTQREIYQQIGATAYARDSEAYLVGGAVRDWLLDETTIDDLDFAVEDDALAFAQSLAASHGGSVITFPKFGSATWRYADQSVDIVMARCEHYPRPAALPEVAPCDILTDLRRRDYTINAMALRLRDGALLDPLNGQADLQARVLRALHPRSFIDDPTRLLRGARYAARLSFQFAPETEALVPSGLPFLRALSGERMKYDLELIFADRHPDRALIQLKRWSAFQAVGVPAPEEAQITQRFQLARERLHSNTWDLKALLPNGLELVHAVGWAVLCWNTGQLGVSRWVEWLPFTHALRDALIALGVLSTMSARLFEAPPSRQSALLRDFSELALLLAWLMESHPHKREAYWRECHVWRKTQPFTSGKDLQARGLPPGPHYSHILQRLRNAWLDGRVRSADEERALLDRLCAELRAGGGAAGAT